MAKITEILKKHLCPTPSKWKEKAAKRQLVYDEVSNSLKRITIQKLDDVSIRIYGDDFDFDYQIADSIVKDEFKGKYDYFGGLQCNYEKNSAEFKYLELKLCIIAENVLSIK